MCLIAWDVTPRSTGLYCRAALLCFTTALYLVTSCMDEARYSTFLEVTPAMEMRPFLVM